VSCEVQQGDVFVSRDKREFGRRLVVVKVENGMAECNVHRLGGRTTKIKVRRLLSSAFSRVNKESA
jgi:hypothetical protein